MSKNIITKKPEERHYTEAGERVQDYIGLKIILEHLNKYSKNKNYDCTINFETNKNEFGTSNFDDIKVVNDNIKRYQVKQLSTLTEINIESLAEIFLNTVLLNYNNLDDNSNNYLIIAMSNDCIFDCDLLFEVESDTFEVSSTEKVYQFKMYDELKELLDVYYKEKMRKAKSKKNIYGKLLNSDYNLLYKFKVIVIKNTWFELTNNEDLQEQLLEKFLLENEFYNLTSNLLIDHNNNILKEIMLYIVSILKTNFKENKKLSKISILYDSLLKRMGLERYNKIIDQSIPIDLNNYVYREKLIEDTIQLINKKNVLFIEGLPGCGKTYFTKALTEKLQEKDYSVCKHYLFINKHDQFKSERIEEKHIFISINSQISEMFPGVISRLSCNIQHIKNEYSYEGENYKKIVIMIDGLDHLFREKSSTKAILSEIVDEFLKIANDNIKVVFLTQPLLELTDNKITVGNFTHSEANQFLEMHKIEKEDRARIISKTDKNPLLLNYLVTCNVDTNENLPENLQAYYENLYNEDTKDLLQYISIGDGFLDINDVKVLSNINDNEFNVIFRKIYQIILQTEFPFKSIMFFHESLNVFIIDKFENYYNNFQKEVNRIKKDILEYFLETDNLKTKIYLPLLIVEAKEYSKYKYKIDILEHLDDFIELYMKCIDMESFYKHLSIVYTQLEDYESLYKVSYLDKMYKSIINSSYVFDDVLYIYLYHLKGYKFVQFILEKNKWYDETFNIFENSAELYIEIAELGFDQFLNEKYVDFYNDKKFLNLINSYDSFTRKMIVGTITYVALNCNSYLETYENILNYLLGKKPHYFSYREMDNDYNFDVDYYIIQTIINDVTDNNDTIETVIDWVVQLSKCLTNDHTFEEFKKIFDAECDVNVAGRINLYTNSFIPYLILESKFNSEILDYLMFNIININEYDFFKKRFVRDITIKIFKIIKIKKFSIQHDTIEKLCDLVYTEFYQNSSNAEVLHYELEKAIINKQYLGVTRDFTTLRHFYAYGSYRDTQMNELIVMADMAIENNGENLYLEIFRLVEMSFHAVSIMDDSKEIRYVPYEILNLYYKKDRKKSIIMAAHFFNITDGDFDYLMNYENEAIRDLARKNFDDEIRLYLYYLCLLNSNSLKYIIDICKCKGLEIEKSYIINEFLSRNLINEDELKYVKEDEPFIKEAKEYLSQYASISYRQVTESNSIFETDKKYKIKYSENIIENWRNIVFSSNKNEDFYIFFINELKIKNNLEELFRYGIKDEFFNVLNFAEFLLNNENVICDFNDYDKIMILIIAFTNSYKWKKLDFVEILEIALKINEFSAKEILKQYLKNINFIPPQSFILKYIINDGYTFFNKNILEIYQYRLPRLNQYVLNYKVELLNNFDDRDILNITLMLATIKNSKATRMINFSTIRGYIYQQILEKLESWTETIFKMDLILSIEIVDSERFYWISNMYINNDYLHESAILANFHTSNINNKNIESIKIKRDKYGYKYYVVEGEELLEKYNLTLCHYFSLLKNNDTLNDAQIYIDYIVDGTARFEISDKCFWYNKLVDTNISEVNYYIVKS